MPTLVSKVSDIQAALDALASVTRRVDAAKSKSAQSRSGTSTSAKNSAAAKKR